MTILYCTEHYSYWFHHFFTTTQSFKLFFLNIYLVGNTLYGRYSIPFFYMYIWVLAFVYIPRCVHQYIQQCLYIGMCTDTYHSVYIPVFINILQCLYIYKLYIYITLFICMLCIDIYHSMVEFLFYFPFRCIVGMSDFQKSYFYSVLLHIQAWFFCIFPHFRKC